MPIKVTISPTQGIVQEYVASSSDAKVDIQTPVVQVAVSYTPGNDANWEGSIPSTLQAALDRLAERIQTLENA